MCFKSHVLNVIARKGCKHLRGWVIKYETETLTCLWTLNALLIFRFLCFISVSAQSPYRAPSKELWKSSPWQPHLRTPVDSLIIPKLNRVICARRPFRRALHLPDDIMVSALWTRMILAPWLTLLNFYKL